MSKKREASSCSNNKQTNEEDSDAFQQGSNAKLAKLDPLSDTTLQDLPMELLECILVKAVVMEVKGRYFVKSHWKKNADLLSSRLKAVNSHWSSILSTNYFRTKLHRTLDEETIRLEMLDQLSIETRVTHIITLNDEIFVLDIQVIVLTHIKKICFLKVYDRNNMAKVKDVIPLPETACSITACNVSKCVYVSLHIKRSLSVLRVTKVAEHQFDVCPWLSDEQLQTSKLYVLGNGNLAILQFENVGQHSAIIMYNANGSLQHKIPLPPGIQVAYRTRVLQKSNGNVILSYVGLIYYHLNLVEMDPSGSVVRQYQSTAAWVPTYVSFAGNDDTIMIIDERNGVELLDSDFHHLGTYVPPHFEGGNLSHYSFYHDSERNEIAHIYYDRNTSPKSKANVLTRFRFA